MKSLSQRGDDLIVEDDTRLPQPFPFPVHKPEHPELGRYIIYQEVSIMPLLSLIDLSLKD